MKLQKFRWSRVYESSEEELTDFLSTRGITAERWTAEALHGSGQRNVSQAMTIWCAEGSLVFRGGDTTTSLQPGDALRIPAGVAFETDAGISGCVCYEAIG